VRIPGVLQRIALCTLLAGPIVLWFNWRQQCGWVVTLFALYSVLMLRVPVPDAAGVIGVGVLEPGRDVGAFVDRWLLNGHLWSASRTWDPEGLVSTLPALANLLLGVLAGRWIEQALTKTEKAVWLLIAGLACLWLGAVLDVTFMPINKSLWTVSYAIFMNGWALVVFGVFYWLLDASPSVRLQQGSAWLLRPCVIYGMNSLFIFALSGVIAKTLLLIKITQIDGSLLSLKAVLYAAIQSLPLEAVDASLLYAMLFNGFMLCIAWLMWRQRWFVKV